MDCAASRWIYFALGRDPGHVGIFTFTVQHEPARYLWTTPEGAVIALCATCCAQWRRTADHVPTAISEIRTTEPCPVPVVPAPGAAR